MTNLLKEICARTAIDIATRKQITSQSVLQERAKQASPPRGFIKALAQKQAQKHIGLIAEIKKASPSRGLIRDDFNPAQHARDYEAGGATCLSVLTDTPYFHGSLDDLEQARAACSLPVIRKDFIIDVYQVIQARAHHADCVLLIMASLSDDQAKELEHAARELGLDVLVEVHDADEMERALIHLKTPLIGINNRNLSSLAIDLNTSLTLRPMLPVDKIPVCESGIRTHDDIARMMDADIHCFLVGESLMLQRNITHATQQLLTR